MGIHFLLDHDTSGNEEFRTFRLVVILAAKPSLPA
jgi:hypothetical protein